MRMHTDVPAAGATVIAPFVVAGWVIDQSAGVGAGVDAIEVWAISETGAGTYLGGATLGGSRPDVAALFGPGFALSGFRLTVTTALRPGQYTLQSFARRAATGRFEVVDQVVVIVRGTTLTDLIPCTAGQVPRFSGSAWDCADNPGPKGDAGAQGAKGDKGDPGPAGAMGPAGTSGSSTFPCAACVDNGSLQTLAAANLVANSSLQTLTAAGLVANSATTATSANTASAIMARDAGGNFVATTGDLTLIRYPGGEPAAITTRWQSATGVTLLRNGGSNFMAGERAGQSIPAASTGNTGVGRQALVSANAGNNNTAVGNTAGGGITGNNNVAIGSLSMGSAITTGADNVAVGVNALANLAGAGASNTALGHNAGQSQVNGSNNIYIKNVGANESATIRIGTDPTQTRAFIAGTRGITTDVADAIPVIISSEGQLGTVSSSRRFKHDILDLGDATSKLYDLRPVSFRYLSSLDKSQTRTYGLIAEEVAEVMPDLVAHDRTGEIETVKYQLLAPLLLNEVQRLKRELDASARAIAALTARLDALEKRVP